MAKTFAIEANKDMGYKHLVGNSACDVSWCDGSMSWPGPCLEKGCNGLVHADFGDEDSDCNYWLYMQCDECGSTDDPH